jgi:hypothetical protein
VVVGEFEQKIAKIAKDQGTGREEAEIKIMSRIKTKA